jgi:lysophospholipase L1-like esterase
VGTNDVADITMPCMLAAQGIVMLMSTIHAINPAAVIVFTGLLIRPKDVGTDIEYRRRLVNKIVYDMCTERGYICIKSWKCLMTRSKIRERVYARDGLHLNRTGARHLYKCIEGNITNLEWRFK